MILLLSLAAVAGAPEPAARFDHGRHQKALARQGLGCPACHTMGVGETESPQADEAALERVPANACHYCHTDPDGERRAPSRCETCHTSVARPDDHVAGWLQDHGAAARMRDCADCHRGSFCVDCHERREPVRYAVHDRGWLGVHGIAVLADPASCGSCHRQDFCVSCHQGGVQ